LISLLKPFYILTTIFCKENHSPGSMMRPLLYKFIENHLKSRDDDSIFLKILKKLKYLNKQSGLIVNFKLLK
jgi:hypothetical protein